MILSNFLVANYITLFSIIGFGLLITKKLKKKDFFFIFLSGYFFIGLISLILNFITPINLPVSLAISIFGLLSFFIFLKEFIKKNNIKNLLILNLIIVFLLITRTDHAIDANMYHNAFISILKSEKIIFGTVTLEFRFGHTSFLQYVQAIFVNKYFTPYNLVSPNTAIFTCFLFFCFYEIKKNKKNNAYIFSVCAVVIFLLTKYARYREFGNDLSALILSAYFFLYVCKYIFNKEYNHEILKYTPVLIVLIFAHKISYVFIGLFYLLFLKEINFKKIFKDFSLIFSFLLIFLFWFSKNIIHTSCLAFPQVLTCHNDLECSPKRGFSQPEKASWLTELWSKDFVNNEQWKSDRSLNLDKYMSNFNWVSTWIKNHFIKILEKTSPLYLLFLIIFLTHFKKEFNFKKKLDKKFYYLFLLNFVGLFIWFYKAPLFRYGASYNIIFIILASIFIFTKFTNFFDIKKPSKTLLVLVMIACTYFAGKNLNRITKSNNNIMPQTVLLENEQKFDLIEKNGFKILRPVGGVCFYTLSSCSHEVPYGINVKKIWGYFLIK